MTLQHAVLAAIEVKPAHMSQAKAIEITKQLLLECGLEGWRVGLDSAKRRAGQCQYRHKVISMSRYLLAQRSFEDSLMTITHEIAHAIVGHKHGHDPVWARQHRALGGNGLRCFEHADEQAPYRSTTCRCDGGTKRYTRYRAPKLGATFRCPRCRTGITFERNR